jgi:hypothetical protein
MDQFIKVILYERSQIQDYILCGFIYRNSIKDKTVVTADQWFPGEWNSVKEIKCKEKCDRNVLYLDCECDYITKQLINSSDYIF